MRPRMLLAVLILAIALPMHGQSSPVPFISQPLVPASAQPGGAAFILTVNGAGFTSSSTVNWNGSARPTTFVSSTQVQAAISAIDISQVGTASVTINNSPSVGMSNAALFPVASPRTAIGFSSTPYPVSGTFPVSVSVADFNGDGVLDMAVATENSGQPSVIPVFLGNGDGTFQQEVDYPAGAGPASTQIGDFNGDGITDIIFGLTNSDVSVLLGKGNGTFLPHVDSPADFGGFLTTADLNGDGKLDVVVAGPGLQYLQVLLGNGNGTFRFLTNVDAGANPSRLTIADFNHDGLLDLAVTNDDVSVNTVSILLGKGDGTFLPRVTYNTGNQPDTADTADFNGDGNLDLVVANANCTPSCAPASVSVLLGNGDGTFRSRVDYPVLLGASFIALADLNGDGMLDIVVLDQASNYVSVLLGNGDGTFQSHVDFPTGIQPYWVSIGDFNDDGKLDLAVADEDPSVNTHNVSVLLQTPAKTTVALSKARLKFGTQVLGTTSSIQKVVLTNGGPITLLVGTVTASGDFSQTTTCGTPVPVGKSCAIKVAFKPTAIDTRNGTVTITDNANTSPQTISLVGTGTVVSLSTKTLNFAPQSIGTHSGPLPVLLTNVGSASVHFSGITIVGVNKADFSQTNTCGIAIVSNANCTINVTFKPSATGNRKATLNISDDGGGSPQKVPLTGTGT